LGIAMAYAIVFSVLMILKHDAFNTRTYDLARFDQAIWNTLHGRFLFSSILHQSILANHFSPLLAALSPLFLIWDDVKVLFVAQAVSVAASGIPLYQIVRSRRPALAPWFLLAYYLNPALHEVTVFEFRRVVLAMPFLALALYALYAKKRLLMALGLGLALLCKENVGFIVFMVGFYLLAFERDWRWGAPLMLLGMGWLVVVSLWVIPAFAPPDRQLEAYPQLYYFGELGDSFAAIAGNVLRDPMAIVGRLFGRERWAALWRTFLPLGLALPFLAPEWVLICVPTMAYMMLSDEPRLYRFETWHLATVLPVLFAATGVGLTRVRPRWSRLLAVLLLAVTALGYVLYSPAPLGGNHDPRLYRVTKHHRLGAAIAKTVPTDASIATQPRYVPHLSHREHVYHYPWVVIGLDHVDYVLLDRASNPYPFGVDGLNDEIDNTMADLNYSIEAEADGIYLFRRVDVLSLDGYAVEQDLRDLVWLSHVEVALADEDGRFSKTKANPITVTSGQLMRVSLYWEALEDVGTNWTVSVRISDQAGRLVAQHDGWPGQGKKPTAWWKKGWEIRDVHYMTVASDAPVGPAQLAVTVYDSETGQTIPFGDQAMLRVCDMWIESL
jgi:uncharacterized membrane protein